MNEENNIESKEVKAPPSDNIFNGKVLIFGEEAKACEERKDMLQREGFKHVHCLTDFALAEAKSLRGEFDLAVCEVNEDAGNNGMQYLTHVARSCPSIAIVAIVDTQDARFILSCLRKGASAIHLEEDSNETLGVILEELALNRLALHNFTKSQVYWLDEDTGLKRRAALIPDLETHLKQSAIDRLSTSLLLVDINDFAGINHQFGYAYGNTLLSFFSEILVEVADDTAGVYRSGTDEFALVLSAMRSKRDLTERCTTLIKNIAEKLGEHEIDFDISFKVGVSYHSKADVEAEQFLREASLALEAAKKEKSKIYALYEDLEDPEMKMRLIKQRKLLKEAVDNENIQVYFQPIVDAKSGKPVRLEALARWIDHDIGFVSPGVFIPMLEEMGLSGDIFNIVFKKVIDSSILLREKGHHLNCSINVSRCQLDNVHLVEDIVSYVKERDEDPKDYTFEITETASYTDEHIMQQLMFEFVHEGFCLSVDDFGTGQSTLTQLSKSSFTELKIDRSLINTIRSPQGLSVYNSIIDMAHRLNMSIVAEGIEDETTASLIQYLDIDYCQGFYYSKPMPLNNLFDYLDAN